MCAFYDWIPADVCHPTQREASPKAYRGGGDAALSLCLSVHMKAFELFKLCSMDALLVVQGDHGGLAPSLDSGDGMFVTLALNRVIVPNQHGHPVWYFQLGDY